MLFGLLLLVSALTATVIPTLVVYLPGDFVRTWVRRLFLVLANLSPWTTGTWRREFSTRETFMAAWFLVFVAVLFGLLFYGYGKLV